MYIQRIQQFLLLDELKQTEDNNNNLEDSNTSNNPSKISNNSKDSKISIEMKKVQYIFPDKEKAFSCKDLQIINSTRYFKNKKYDL